MGRAKSADPMGSWPGVELGLFLGTREKVVERPWSIHGLGELQLPNEMVEHLAQEKEATLPTLPSCPTC